MAHAARTAEAIGGASAAPWDELDAALGASDIVITATGAAAPILTKAHIEAVMRPRRNRPLFIIDIAMPRDVEAGGRRNRAGVPLQHRRSAGDGSREPGAARQRSRTAPRAIVNEEVEKFAGWFRSRGAIPTVVALRQRFEAIRRAELERLDFKLSSLPAGGARARRRDHAPDRREAAADADRAAEGARRLGAVAAYTEALTRLFALTDQQATTSRATPRTSGPSNDRRSSRSSAVTGSACAADEPRPS